MSVHHCKCVRCDWEWISRLPEPPARCAKCHSINWKFAKPERAQAAGVDVPGKIGKPRKYRFYDLAVNESIVELWYEPGKEPLIGQPLGNPKIINSLRQWERRSGRKHWSEGTPFGLRITRRT